MPAGGARVTFFDWVEFLISEHERCFSGSDKARGGRMGKE